MRNATLLIFVLYFLIVLPSHLSAQELDRTAAIELVSKNRLQASLSEEDIQNSKITNAYKDRISGLTLIYLQQTYEDIPVYNVLQVLALRDDAVVSNTGERIYNIAENIVIKRTTAPLSPSDALSIAVADVMPEETTRRQPSELMGKSTDELVYDFTPAGKSKEPITVEKLWVPLENGSVRLAWQVKLLPPASADYWLIRIDANDGSILGRDNLTVYCSFDGPDMEEHLSLSEKVGLTSAASAAVSESLTAAQPLAPFAVNSGTYRVVPFPAESPAHVGGTPSVVTNPWLLSGAGNAATTLGWHNDGLTEYFTTRGNNVLAYEDAAANNAVGRMPISTSPLPNLQFDFPFNPSDDPASTNNQNVGIVNLFYWNNLVHDLSYQYGFDEVSGNFQNSNLGRGGLGNDYVLAEAQDGAGINNANFSVGPDGNRPRMQMYLWEKDAHKKVTFNLPLVYQGINISSVESNMSPNNKLRNVGPVTADLISYDEGGATPDLACNPAINATQLNGKIALIQRGGCDFTTKVKNAQNAGAVGVLVYNSEAGLSTMSGEDHSIIIPALMILQADGPTLKSIMQHSTINLTLSGSMLLDGDLDNGIIVHEYAHGISNRLTGGAATVSCLQNQEQMGEGWSDYYGLMMTTDWATATPLDGAKKRGFATYASGGNPELGDSRRSRPYSTDMAVNSLTYNHLLTLPENSPHALGELWAAVLWDMTWNMIQVGGINENLFNANGAGGNSDALKLVTLGMKLQPCSPGFLDGRDALLKADELLFNGKYQCAIWSAFARRGMGTNARQGSSARTNDQTEGFDRPGPGITVKASVAETPQNAELVYTLEVKALCDPLVNYKIVDTLPSNVTYLSGGDYDAANRTVTFNIASLAAQQSATFTLRVKVKAGTYFAPSVVFSETLSSGTMPSTLVASTTLPGATWAITTQAKSTPYALKSGATASSSDQILRSASSFAVTAHTQLSFWHQFITQESRDGGVVELSTDGINWFDARPYFAVNPYNTTIHATSPIEGRRAFSGNGTNFTESVINLSAFEGEQVYFRFRFVTDDATSSLGWYIDDIQINTYPAVYNLAGLYNASNGLVALSDTITKITSELLPVVWGSFSAQNQGGTAVLRWTTLQELNTRSFVVEHSTDGVRFTPLHTMEARGSSAMNTDYTYVHQQPEAGTNYYRIKLIDIDGAVSFSEARSLHFDQMLPRLTLSPNPVRQQLHIYVAGNKENLQVKILDVSGRVVDRFRMNGEKHSLSVGKYAEGTYFMHITGTHIKAVSPFVKE